MKLEILNIDEVKDLLKNTSWRKEMLSYTFHEDTLKLSGHLAEKYEVVESPDRKVYIKFKGVLVLVEHVDENSLRINDGGAIITLNKV